jgi:hypothetical protein
MKQKRRIIKSEDKITQIEEVLKNIVSQQRL